MLFIPSPHGGVEVLDHRGRCCLAVRHLPNERQSLSDNEGMSEVVVGLYCALQKKWVDGRWKNVYCTNPTKTGVGWLMTKKNRVGSSGGGPDDDDTRVGGGGPVNDDNRFPKSKTPCPVAMTGFTSFLVIPVFDSRFPLWCRSLSSNFPCAQLSPFRLMRDGAGKRKSYLSP